MIITFFFENFPLREVLNMSKMDKTHVFKKKIYKHVKKNTHTHIPN